MARKNRKIGSAMRWRQYDMQQRPRKDTLTLELNLPKNMGIHPVVSVQTTSLLHMKYDYLAKAREGNDQFFIYHAENK